MSNNYLFIGTIKLGYTIIVVHRQETRISFLFELRKLDHDSFESVFEVTATNISENTFEFIR